MTADDTPPDQLERVKRTFEAAAKLRGTPISELRFLPFDQCDEDPARYELDRVLAEIMGWPPEIAEFGGALDLLRRKLAREPSIHGGKQSRVVFDEGGGEHSERRFDRPKPPTKAEREDLRKGW